MTKVWMISISIMLVLMLAACDLAPTAEAPPPAVEVEVVTPTAEAVQTQTEDNTIDTEAAVEPEQAAEQTETEVETVFQSPLETIANLPQPSIFETSWLDRSIFEAGLIDSEQGVLADLPGASVYHIAVTISDDLKLLSGREELFYTNTEPVPLNEIYIHLYPNLLGGFETISNLQVNGTSVEPTFEFSDSAMRVPLPEALPPGQQTVIAMDFTIAVPESVERNYGIFAYAENVLALAHFYPLVAVYDDQGWDIENPAQQGDVVYADTSFYLVQVTAPADLNLVASGVEVAREQSESQQTVTIAAGPMRDFYIAASNQYQVVSQTVGQTTINSFAPLAWPEANARILQHAVDSLNSFNARYGLYPFTELDLVGTSNLALGIEYPGIVAITLRLYDLNATLAEVPTPIFLEATVSHEVAHQWFYSIVGNDQLAEPWIDESLTQYATWRYYLDVNGPGGATGFERDLQARWERVEQADIPIGLPVSEYKPEEYGAIVYGRGPLFFAALAERMGQESLDQFLYDYAQNNRWKNVSGADLQQQAEQHCSCDLDDLFAEWVYRQ